MNSITPIKSVETPMPRVPIRRGEKLRVALKKQAWFAGLYTVSLVFLSGTGISLRWVLTSL